MKRFTIWYQLHNLKNVEKKKKREKPANLVKATLPMGVFYVFKIVHMVPDHAKYLT